MTQAWCVGVAALGPGQLYKAAEQAVANGFGVCVPEQFVRERQADKSSRLIWRALMAPYFFVRFDLASDDEFSLFKSLRGVDDALCRWGRENERRVPRAIDVSVIQEHECRMLTEKRDATYNWRKSSPPVSLGKVHKIMKHPNFAGQEGVLIAVSRGVAELRVGPWLISVQAGDIAPITAERAAA